VVRLKGGDPFVFGRGGEELDALLLAGVEVEVVPGISSALGLPARLGVSLTHRGVARSVTIISGHAGTDGSTDWGAVARLGGTVVVLMGVEHRGAIATELERAGLGAETPVLVIERGATEHERTVATTLAELGSTVVHAPALLVIGDVAHVGTPRPPWAVVGGGQ
jgi:siroheme synthase